MAEKRRIQVTVNGVLQEGSAEPRTTLADFLRGELALTGTHVGCEHGVCGACTVLLDGRAVRACLLLAVQVDGASVMTVEGLSQDGRLHPIQEAFVEEHGLQCGFCTPGFLMTVHELLGDNPDPSDDEIRDALGGNICRCTGYQSILRSVRRAAIALRGASAAVGEQPSSTSSSRE
jgi:3-oxo-Delta1-steroid hydratase/dehydrogenase small subunit